LAPGTRRIWRALMLTRRLQALEGPARVAPRLTNNVVD
jgi:hypothetical protein